LIHICECRRSPDQVRTFVVIEDDPDIQVLVEDAISDGGFEVTIVPSGEAGLTLLGRGNARYVAVVTDINVSGTLDDWQVARGARQIDPTKAIV
jgi:DNA-binding response OmpR family regulator